jgi:hypothetical protein
VLAGPIHQLHSYAVWWIRFWTYVPILFIWDRDDDDDSEKVIVIGQAWRRQWFSSQNAHGKKPMVSTVGHSENCISCWPKNWKSFDTLSLVAKNNITTKVLRCKPRNPQAILAKTTCLVSSYIFTMFPMLFMGSFWFSALVGCMGQNYQLSPPKLDGFSSEADSVGSSKLMESSVSIPKYKGFLEKNFPAGRMARDWPDRKR